MVSRRVRVVAGAHHQYRALGQGHQGSPPVNLNGEHGRAQYQPGVVHAVAGQPAAGRRRPVPEAKDRDRRARGAPGQHVLGQRIEVGAEVGQVGQQRIGGKPRAAGARGRAVGGGRA